MMELPSVLWLAERLSCLRADRPSPLARQDLRNEETAATPQFYLKRTLFHQVLPYPTDSSNPFSTVHL